MYIEMENVIQKTKTKMYIYRQVFKHNYAKDAHTHTHTHARTHAHTHTHTRARARTHTHTHSHTVQTDGSEGQFGLTEIFWQEKCLELTFEGRESSRVPDILGEIAQDVGAKVWESAKAIGFAVETLDFEHTDIFRHFMKCLISRIASNIYIYIERERERESNTTWFLMSSDVKREREREK